MVRCFSRTYAPSGVIEKNKCVNGDDAAMTAAATAGRNIAAFIGAEISCGSFLNATA